MKLIQGYFAKTAHDIASLKTFNSIMMQSNIIMFLF